MQNLPQVRGIAREAMERGAGRWSDLSFLNYIERLLARILTEDECDAALLVKRDGPIDKIPTLFVRSEDNRALVTSEVTPGCEWVFNDQLAVATRKYDGTCVKLSRNGHWYARREVKAGKDAPPNYEVVQQDHVTGKLVGWEPIEQSGFARWHAEALDWLAERGLVQLLRHGTYELCGPKINGNPEGFEVHVLVKHGADVLIPTAPMVKSNYHLSYTVIKEWVHALPYEGIVWHHPNGQRAKIKKRDFGYRR